MKSVVKHLLFLILIVISPFHMAAQGQLYPNMIPHMSCDALLKGPYIVQPEDIHDLVKNDLVDMKMVIYDGFLESGITDKLNAIFINKEDYKTLFPNGKHDIEFTRSMEDFINKVPLNSQEYNNISVISTYKNRSREIISYFHFREGRIIGYVHPGKESVNTSPSVYVLETELDYAVQQNKKVLWIGDDVTLKVADLARHKGAVFYRRMHSIEREYPEKLASYEMVFNPAESVVCNAIPHTKSQIVQGGVPASSQKNWVQFRDQVENLTDAFAKRITRIDDLKKELLHGESDVFFVIAHLNGSNIYIGETKVTLEQIRQWGTRIKPTSGKRIGVLCICNSGNQRYRVGSLLWKTKVDPLANILLDNKYFDQVFAPDHTIYRPETLSLITHLTKNKSVERMQEIFPGWWSYVYTRTRTKNTCL